METDKVRQAFEQLALVRREVDDLWERFQAGTAYAPPAELEADKVRQAFEKWVTDMEPAYADSNLERLTGGRGGYKVHNVACWWMAWQAAYAQSAAPTQGKFWSVCPRCDDGVYNGKDCAVCYGTGRITERLVQRESAAPPAERPAATPDYCQCELPYFGAQPIGTPPKCERCFKLVDPEYKMPVIQPNRIILTDVAESGSQPVQPTTPQESHNRQVSTGGGNQPFREGTRPDPKEARCEKCYLLGVPCAGRGSCGCACHNKERSR